MSGNKTYYAVVSGRVLPQQSDFPAFVHWIISKNGPGSGNGCFAQSLLLRDHR